MTALELAQVHPLPPRLQLDSIDLAIARGDELVNRGHWRLSGPQSPTPMEFFRFRGVSVESYGSTGAFGAKPGSHGRKADRASRPERGPGAAVEAERRRRSRRDLCVVHRP